jgi:hypothetical protein
LKQVRLAALAASVVVLFALVPGRNASAAPEVHNFNVMFSAGPTSISGGGLSDLIDQYNDRVLEPNGFKSLERITLGWLFEVEMRYLVRPNVGISLGLGQLKSETSREFLPAINQSIDVRFEALTVPVHLGADYYFTPYTQGDFQARYYVGGGLLSNIYSVVTFQQQVSDESVSPLPGGSFNARATRDSPGYYLQTGAHMFFAARYSVMLGIMFRSAELTNLVDTETGEPVLDFEGNPLHVDLSGVGVKLALGLGF